MQAAAGIAVGIGSLMALLTVKLFAASHVQNVHFMLWGAYLAFGVLYLIQVSRKILLEKNQKKVKVHGAPKGR